MGLLTKLSDIGEYAISRGKRPAVEVALRNALGFPDSEAAALLPPNHNPRRQVLRYYNGPETRNADGSLSYDQFAWMRNDQGHEWENFLGRITLR